MKILGPVEMTYHFLEAATKVCFSDLCLGDLIKTI